MMKVKTGLNELRTAFLDFYKKKDHYHKKSASLVPDKDKSLLLINSGMAPLKPYFAGLETPPSKRMTTCQKCIRTADIDNVGMTSRHGTFFEMLGSFSFGDYFKTESLEWGWEFMINVLKLPKEKLWATVYEEDDEAFEIWRDHIGMPEERIVRLGKEDNFWEIGIGPCGPCSEIYYDRGEKFGCNKTNCKPGCECDRYVEFWNHVFTQFNKDAEGNYIPLEKKNIDTGMGLERLACIMQNVDSIFDIDTIRSILDEVVRISGVEYTEGKSGADVSIRIITDHIRSVTFMIGDNVLPGNEGRGYVLRRLLRRAARHGRLLGINGAFLADLSKKVIQSSGDAYPEIKEKQDYIYKIISIEENKFSDTIDQGIGMLSDHIKHLKAEGKDILSGEDAFKLYDTFGFPIELTKEIIEEEGLKVDQLGFVNYMEEQKQKARIARKSETDEGWSGDSYSHITDEMTTFIGNDNHIGTGKIKKIFKDQKESNELVSGEKGTIILDQTPFHAEEGGQVADEGIISNDSFEGTVTSVRKINHVILHHVTAKKGTLKKDDSVEMAVDIVRRNSIARNHTATHLLHKCLKSILGQHVEQAGSFVDPDSLRFDFTHFEALSKEEISKVEEAVNDAISHFIPLSIKQIPLQEAIKKGAIALFDEKYGDLVRVVSIGDFSIELCGGSHVKDTGQIGAFKILSESGVAAGVRRIEGVTGMGLYRRLADRERLLKNASELLKTNAEGITDRIFLIQNEVKELKKELDKSKNKALDDVLKSLDNEVVEIKGVKLICKRFDNLSIEDLRNASDKIKESMKSIISVLASENEGKITFLVTVSNDLQEKGYHAGNMIKQIAAAAGGGGGGKANMAQAGAKDPSKIEAAFQIAKNLI